MHHTPAGHRLRRAGRAGEADRQALERAGGEVGEELRLQRVAAPADRSPPSPSGGAVRSAELAHQRRRSCARRRRRSPPPGATPDLPQGVGDGLGGEGGQRRGAVLRREALPRPRGRSRAGRATWAPAGRSRGAPSGAASARLVHPCRRGPGRRRRRSGRGRAARPRGRSGRCRGRCPARATTPSREIVVRLATPPMFSTAVGGGRPDLAASAAW